MSAQQPVEIGQQPRFNTGCALKTEHRSVQRMGGGGNSLTINLTEVGTAVLGVEAKEQQQLIICEKGIWIPRHD